MPSKRFLAPLPFLRRLSTHIRKSDFSIDLRREPYKVFLHIRICAGACQQWPFLTRGPCPLRRFCCCVYEKRELSFDETFRDICLALSEKQRRGKRDVTLDFLVKPLEEEIRGKVSLEGGRFYVTGADGSIEAHLLSEGWRKLAGEVFRTRPPGL